MYRSKYCDERIVKFSIFQNTYYDVDFIRDLYKRILQIISEDSIYDRTTTGNHHNGNG